MQKLNFPNLFIVVIVFVSQSLLAAGEMNGYKLSDFKDFEKNWNFVTARFRKDTGEMRFTFANDIAWKALGQHVTSYPEGAVFAKFSARTQEDIDFPSSSVPSGARRVQFMVRSQKKHSSTGGWGYALFKPDGRLFPGDMKSKSLACAACHQIVEDRGQVFSQKMAFLGSSINFVRKETPLWSRHLDFREKKTNQILESARNLIPKKFKSVLQLNGKIEKALFSGSLDELRPLLLKKSIEARKPTILVSSDKAYYILVFPDSSVSCDSSTGFTSFHTAQPNSKNPVKIDVCEDSFSFHH